MHTKSNEATRCFNSSNWLTGLPFTIYRINERHALFRHTSRLADLFICCQSELLLMHCDQTKPVATTDIRTRTRTRHMNTRLSRRRNNNSAGVSFLKYNGTECSTHAISDTCWETCCYAAERSTFPENLHLPWATLVDSNKKCLATYTHYSNKHKD